MPTNDEFPRGFDIATQAGSISLPAVPGVAHILTAVNIYIVTTALIAAFYAANVQATPLLQMGFMSMPPNTPAGSLFPFNWAGKGTTAIGAALGVSLSVGVPAGAFVIIEIQGYDI